MNRKQNALLRRLVKQNEKKATEENQILWQEVVKVLIDMIKSNKKTLCLSCNQYGHKTIPYYTVDAVIGEHIFFANAYVLMIPAKKVLAFLANKAKKVGCDVSEPCYGEVVIISLEPRKKRRIL